eukprot:UN10871
MKANQFPLQELKGIIAEFTAWPAIALKQEFAISKSTFITELQREYDSRMKQIKDHNTNYQRIRFIVNQRINQTWIFERAINAEYESQPLVERKAFLIMETTYPYYKRNKFKEVLINRNSKRFEISVPYETKVSTCYLWAVYQEEFAFTTPSESCLKILDFYLEIN